MRKILFITLIVLLLFCVPLASGFSFFEWLKKVTGFVVSEDCVLFGDDFESGGGKWNFMSSTGQPLVFGNEWSIVSDGTKVLEGINHNWAYLSEENSWDNYVFRTKIKLVSGGVHINFRRNGRGRYFLGFNQEGLNLNKNDLSGNIYENLILDNSRYNLNEWYNFKIVLDGSNIKIYVNDVLKIDYTDTSPLISGSVAFETLDNSVVYFDDVKISGACVSPSIQQCTDSDNGIIYNLKGTINGIDPVTNQYATKTDFCHKLVSDDVPVTSGPYLFEYACQANTNKISWHGGIYCEHGCEYGVCTEEPIDIMPPTCNNNGVCEAGETNQNCPPDCGPVQSPTPLEGILFQDDFNDGNTEGWQLDDGWNLVQEPSGGYSLQGTGHKWANAGSTAWADYTFESKVKLAKGGIHINAKKTEEGRYFVSFNEEGISLHKQFNNWQTFAELKRVEEAFSLNQPYAILMAVEGSNIKVYVNDILKIDYTDPNPLTSGSIAFESLPESQVYVDGIIVRGEVCNNNGVCDSGLGETSNNCPNDCVILPPSSIGEWATILEDNFDDGNAEGWDLEEGWSVFDDKGNFVLRGLDHKWARGGEKNWVDYSFETKLKLIRGGVNVNFRVNNDGRYFLGVNEEGLYLNKQFSEWRQFEDLTRIEKPITKNAWYNLKVMVGDFENNNHILVYLDSELVISSTDDGIGFGSVSFESLEDSEVYVDAVVVKGVAASCENGVQDPNEGGVDCGGTCPTACPIPASCDDEIMNQDETGVDCGGSCSNQNCCANNHFDKESGELGIDCGGPCPTMCVWHKTNGPIGGKLLKVAVNPKNNNIIYTSGYPITNYPKTDGGFFKSFNKGENWEEISKGIDNKELWGLVLDKNNPTILFVGSQDGEIYKTTDEGENWRKVKNKGDDFETIYSLEIDSTNSNNVYAGSRYGHIYKSSDGGETWKTIDESKGLTTGGVISSIHTDPKSPNVLYATSGFIDVWGNQGWGNQGNGVFKSEDYGETWKPINNGIDLTLYHNFGDVAIDPRNSNVIYAVNGLINEEVGSVFKSINGGESWQKLNLDSELSAVELDPTNPDIIWVAGSGRSVYKSEDGGQSWVRVNNGLEGSFITSLMFDPVDPQIMYTSFYASGIFRSDDKGQHWKEINDKHITFSYTTCMVADPTKPGTLYTGNQAGKVSHTYDGGETWETVFSPGEGKAGVGLAPFHGREYKISQSDPQIGYAVLLTGGLIKTEDSFNTWKENSPTFSLGQKILRVITGQEETAEIQRDPTRTQEPVAGQEVFDDGAQLQEVVNPLVFTTTIDPINADVTYLGTMGYGILKTADGGNSWRQINDGLTSNDLTVTSISTGQQNLGKVYASSIGPLGHLFVSENGGESWMEPNPDFTFTNVQSLTKNPNGEVYAATWGGGTFKTSNGGESWEKMEKFPISAASIAISPTHSNVIYTTDKNKPIFSRSEDGGQNWEQIWHGPNMNDPEKTIYSQTHALGIDPTDDEIVYFSALKKGELKGSLFKFKNGEVSEIGADLPRGVVKIAIEPTNAQNVYAALQVYGLYKSRDGGQSWNKLNNAPKREITDLVINPQNPGTLYATVSCGALTNAGEIPQVGLPIDLPYPEGSCGVYKSSDGGESWQSISSQLLNEVAVRSIKVEQGRLYAATENGVYISENDGQSWVLKNEGLTFQDASSIIIQGDDLYVGAQGAGVYKTAKNNIEWQKTNGPFADILMAKAQVDPKNQNVVYLGSFPGGMFKSDNGGLTWRAINSGLFCQNPNEEFAMILGPSQIRGSNAYYNFIINPEVPTNLYLALFSVGIYRSDDGGESWRPMNSGLENKMVYVLALDSLGGNLYAGTNGGSVFKASIAGGPTPKCDTDNDCSNTYCFQGIASCKSSFCVCETVTQECKQGCLYENRCIPFGFRVDREYCDLDGSLKGQKSEGNCSNNFECRSNLCVGDKCIELELWQKFMNWLKSLF